MTRNRCAARVLVAVALVIAGLVVPLRSASARAGNCGARDLPETGVQGEVPARDQATGRALRGYNCGLALVGHVGINGPSANMAWAKHCAYVASVGTGIAVIDVADPRHPKHTTTLHGSGSDFSLETIAAKDVGNRAVLVAGRYGLASGAPVPAPMDVYDATNCAHPKLLTTFQFPENIHNLSFSPDGTKVFTTLPIQVADIRDPAHPRFIGNLERDIPMPSFFSNNGLPASYLAHEIQTSADGNTLYLGGQTPQFNLFTIVDIAGWPARKPRILSQVQGRGHSVRLAHINGRTYAVHSEEAILPTGNSCFRPRANPFAGAAQPWMSDVTDPVHPVMHISKLTLAINQRSMCPRAALDHEVASVHYQDVDNAQQTTFVMASMWNAGLRLFDVRDPRHPAEVAYFNPGTFLRPSDNGTLDKAWGHVRYDAATGHIWFATQSGGFWVVELEPQLRARLGLPAVAVAHPQGRPARAGVTQFDGGEFGVNAPAVAPQAAAFCTLGPIAALQRLGFAGGELDAVGARRASAGVVGCCG